MSSVTSFSNCFPIMSTQTISDILAREQARFGRTTSLTVVPNFELSRADLAFASREERLGAYLLRVIIENAHAVISDAEVTILRIIVSNRTFDQLEMWGAENIDYEPGHDAEQPLR